MGDAIKQKVVCGECGAQMVLRKSPHYKKPFWGCSQFPKCKGTHSAHVDGRPMGIPSNRATKDWRIKAHLAFDALWEGRSRTMTRKEAYRKLAEKMGVSQIHMAESDIETCKKIIEVVLTLKG